MSWRKGFRRKLDHYTLRALKRRLMEIAKLTGSLSADDIASHFNTWEREGTDVPALIVAGRILKLTRKGAWAEEEQARFDKLNTKRFRLEVAEATKKILRRERKKNGP